MSENMLRLGRKRPGWDIVHIVVTAMLAVAVLVLTAASEPNVPAAVTYVGDEMVIVVRAQGDRP